jgi:hypothetical protein
MSNIFELPSCVSALELAGDTDLDELALDLMGLQSDGRLSEWRQADAVARAWLVAILLYLSVDGESSSPTTIIVITCSV